MTTSRRCLFSAATLAIFLSAAIAVSHAQTYTDLFNFDTIHGATPTSPGILAQGRDGNLYGTAPISREGGVVFSFTTGGFPKVLHNFVRTDGQRPYSGLTMGTDGDFYGTTFLGGTENLGTVFKIAANGTLTTLHNFTKADGITETPPIQAADGDFFGTTATTAYRVAPSGGFTSLPSLYGASPANPLFQATDGNLYGTTGDGGSSNHGTVFKMTTEGTVTVIFNFDAHVPGQGSTLMQGNDGNFYGTTYEGGDNKFGTVFKLTPRGVATALHSFSDPNYPNDGAYPVAGLLQASDGNFYGVTVEGGSNGHGVIFEITPAGDYSILYNFEAATGNNPESTPIQHTNGKIYGLTEGGGTNGVGVAYSFDLGLPPFARLLPVIGKVGEVVEILGQGFTGTTAVSFNGTAAAFNVASDTYLTATVPTGATSGIVSVTTPSGVLNSNQSFQVKP